MKNIYSFLILLLILFSTACTKLDLRDVESDYDSSLAIPLCKYHASVIDILQKQDTAGMIYYNPDKTIFIYWKDKQQVVKFDFLDFSTGSTIASTIRLKDKPGFEFLNTYTTAGTFPEGIYNFLDTTIYEFDFNSKSSTKDYSIDSIYINKSNILLGVNVNDLYLNEQNYLQMNFTFPTLRRCATNSFGIRITSNSTDVSRVLSRFLADFTDIPDSKNGILMKVEYKFVSNGTTRIGPDASVSLETIFDDIDYNTAYGRLWNQNSVYDNTHTMKVPSSLFSQDVIKNNHLLFHNPVITVTLNHNLGADLSYKLDYVCAIDRNGNLRYADFNGQQDYTQVLNRPSTPHNLSENILVFDRNFGATNRLFEGVPDSIKFKYHVFVGKKDGGHNDFVVNPMMMTLDIETRAEMSFDPTSDFNLYDTISADMTSINPSLGDYMKVERLDLNLDATNGIPVKMDLSLTLLDSLNNPIYTTPEVQIPCSEIDANGVAVKSVQKLVTFSFEGNDIEKVSKTKKIVFNTYVSGRDAQSMITLRVEDALDANVSIFAKMKTNINKVFNK